MKLFKNKVGRPSNEILKKRKIIKISMFLLIALIASVLTFTLSKINNKKLKGTIALNSLELGNYKLLEEGYVARNFKKIGDNYYVFLRNNGKYYLAKLKDNYSLGEKLELNVESGDSLDLDSCIYVTEDNKIIAVGSYYIYKYTISGNEIIKSSTNQRVFENSSINHMNFTDDKVLVWIGSSNNYTIKTYSLDDLSLSNTLEYNIDETDALTYSIDVEQIILNEEGNYELLLSYKNISSTYFEKFKILTINSSGSPLNSKEITSSYLNFPVGVYSWASFMVSYDKFEFLIKVAYKVNEERKYQINYILLDGNNVISKSVEVNLSDFYEGEYDASQTGVYSTFQTKDDIKFITMAMAQKNGEIIGYFGTMKLDENENFKVSSKYNYDLMDEVEGISLDGCAFYDDNKFLFSFDISGEDDTDGYFILNYEEKYNLSMDETSNGTVALIGDDTSFKNGDSVSFTVTPNEGYEVKSIKVLDESNNDITESVNLNLTNNTFNMPNKNVKLQVEFDVKLISGEDNINEDNNGLNDTTSNNTSTKTTLNKFSTNPKTYDDVVKYLIIGAISIVIIGLSVVVVIKNKNK